MFFLLSLLALTVQPATKPTPWIGTLEFRDSRGLTVGRVFADLAITDKTFAGDLRSKSGASGRLTGTIDDKGRVKATVVVYGGAQFADGSTEPERCQGEATADGQLHGGTVLRLTIDRIMLDTRTQRIRNRQCQDMTRVVLLLQPFEH